MTTGKTAFVFGASGLVGGNLAKELVKNPGYSRVVLFVRKILAVVSPKVQEIDLDKYDTFDFSTISVNDIHVFCCLGTTIKNAGSKEEFRKVDYELPFQLASWARTKEIQTFVVISSIGADETSRNFYLKTKGEMEEAIKTLNFPKLYIIRPSLLMGTRSEFRLGEEIAKLFSGIFNYTLFGPFRKYRPIEASKVAKAMMILANSTEKEIVIESNRLESLAASVQKK